MTINDNNPIPSSYPNAPEASVLPPASRIPCKKCDFTAQSDDQMEKHMRVRHFHDQKILFVGDSVSQAANFNPLERYAKKSIKTVIIPDASPDPAKNFFDTVELELKKDSYKYLVLAGGNDDITHLNTKNEDAFNLREAAIHTAKNILSIAEAALQEYSSLVQVIIVKTTPRFDSENDDPLHLKPQLAQLVDSVLFGFLVREQSERQDHYRKP